MMAILATIPLWMPQARRMSIGGHDASEATDAATAHRGVVARDAGGRTTRGGGGDRARRSDRVDCHKDTPAGKGKYWGDLAQVARCDGRVVVGIAERLGRARGRAAELPHLPGWRAAGERRLGRATTVANYPLPKPDGADHSAQTEHRNNLYSRLEAGYERIERGLRDGEPVTEWED